MSEWVHEVELPSGVMMKRRLVLTVHTIYWQQEQIPVDAINDVGVQVVKQSVNGIPTTTTYKVRLASPQQKLVLQWAAASTQSAETKALCQQTLTVLSDLLDDRVGRRLAAGIAATSDEFPPWRFGPDGIHHKGLFSATTVPWQQVQGAQVASGSIAPVYVDAAGRTKRLSGLSTWEPNAWFLQQILVEQRRRWTGW